MVLTKGKGTILEEEDETENLTSVSEKKIYGKFGGEGRPDRVIQETLRVPLESDLVKPIFPKMTSNRGGGEIRLPPKTVEGSEKGWNLSRTKNPPTL